MTMTFLMVGAGEFDSPQPFLCLITFPMTWTFQSLRCSSAPGVVNGLSPLYWTFEPAGTVYLPAVTNGFECLLEWVTSTMMLLAALAESSLPPSTKPTFGWCMQRLLTWWGLSFLPCCSPDLP